VQRAILVDGDKCVGCYSCVVACKLEHNLPPYSVHPPVGDPQGPELIRIHQIGPQIGDDQVRQHFEATTCLHCLDAPCIGACPTSAIYKDVETGVTLVHEDQCTGCETCLSVCPYGAPQFYSGRLYLCDLCMHRLREGRQTACEAACPARAIRVGTTDEVSALIAEKTAGRAGRAEQVLG
jgi:anaerobic dimethyl sulfoxide reductase subunit B (iron-sulfur subunit)